MSFSPYDLILNLVTKKKRRLPWSFSSRAYRAFNPETALSGFYPRKHYSKIGKKEGRIWQLNILTGKAYDDTKKTIVIIADLKRATSSHIEDCLEEFAKKYNVALIARVDDKHLKDALQHCFKILLSPTIDGPFYKKIQVMRFIKKLPNLEYALVDYHENNKIVYRLWKNNIANVFFLNGKRVNAAPVLFRSLLGATRIIYSTKRAFKDATYTNFWGYPDQRTILPPVSTHIDYAPHIPQDDEDLIVLGAGTPDHYSGQDTFLDVAQRFKQAKLKKHVHFIWVELSTLSEDNGAYKRSIEHLVGHYNLQNNVSFIQAEHLSADILKRAHVFLDTSRYENNSRAGQVALSAGLPVIMAQDIAPLSHLIKQYQLEDICLANNHDSEQFYLKLKHLLELKDWKSVLQKTKALSASLPTIETYVQKLDEIGCLARLQLNQEKNDIHYLEQKPVIDMSYWHDRSHPKVLNHALAQNFIRNWKSGTAPRRPFAGFHPGIYAQMNDLGPERNDSTIHYLKHGQPEGPWKWHVIREAQAISQKALDTKIALQIHAYYPDMLAVILQKLLLNKIRPDLFISVKDEKSKQDAAAILKDYPHHVDIRVVPNKGRDIGPLITEFGKELAQKYEIIGHLHTKNSIHINDRDVVVRWTNFLMENLLGNVNCAAADTIIENMVANDDVGLIFPDDRNAVSWAKNFDVAQELAPKLQIETLPHFIIFPVGTMFWMRARVLKKFVDLDLSWDDYPIEPLANDGTMLHAIERLLGVDASIGKEKIMTTLFAGTKR